MRALRLRWLAGLSRHRPRLTPTFFSPAQARKDARKVIFKRADQYVKEYRDKEKEEIRLKREARSTGDFYVPAQPKVYFVVRIKGCVQAWRVERPPTTYR